MVSQMMLREDEPMPVSESQKRAAAKWQKTNIDDIRFRAPKGKRTLIQEHAAKTGESMNAFLNRAVDETIARDNAEGKTI